MAGAGGVARSWPSAAEYQQAIQNPSTAFREQSLRRATPAVDRLGMPLVMSGNFAYVFKLKLAEGGARGIKCFRRELGDRAARYAAIDSFLDRTPIKYVASFEYDANGVRVGGSSYPTLVMDWIDGPTLDVYVDGIIRQGAVREPLAALARQWAELVTCLRSSRAAHGDLQHGNVIVTTGGLRLVDLDGMYVPALSGRGAPEEVGHRHFQHPRRTVRDFGEELDSFSALVVYLSLLALADAPELWREYHDDNLIFVRRDFESPAASPLFRRLTATPGDVGRLAQALADASRGPLHAVPAFASLVSVRESKLPLWLRDPVVRTVDAGTREAPPAPGPGTAQPPSGSAGTPSRPQSPAFLWGPVGVRGGGATPAGAGSAVGAPVPPAPLATAVGAPSASGPDIDWSVPCGCGCVWGVFALIVLMFVGLVEWSPWTAIGLSVGVAAWVTFKRASEMRSQAAQSVAPQVLASTTSAPAPPGPPGNPGTRAAPTLGGAAPASGAQVRSVTPQYMVSPPWRHVSWSSGPPSGSAGSAPSRGQSGSPGVTPQSRGPQVVASKLRSTYHRPYCRWAGKISARNRVTFVDAGEARATGYRACGECQP